MLHAVDAGSGNPFEPRSSTPEAGFTLLEALAALAIVALVVTSFLGIRTSALIDATYARNWRLARELAEEKMSELLAGARETPPEPGAAVPFEKYPEFSYEFVIGESAVAEIESKVAAAGGDTDTEAGAAASERAEWQRNREMYRKASSRGQSYMDYQDQLVQEDYRRKLEETAPSETEFEEAAVLVWFPKVNSETEGAKDAFVIKAKVSTLALTGMTPEAAEASAKARGLSPAGSGAPGGSGPAGGASPLGGNTGNAGNAGNAGNNRSSGGNGGK